MAVYQILVKHLDGQTHCLQFPTPTISGSTLRQTLESKSHVPFHLHRLTTSRHVILEDTLLVADLSSFFPSCAVLARLRGGKGGFGSLLRGAATKAGQKKTNNFDACRDMSGRRLRHVNAEKRLEEWKAGADDRKLEKIAEQFLRKQVKEAKKKDSGEAEKYLAKYKEDSQRCLEEVEESVRESFELYEKSKRKVLPASGPASKRLKIWLGKKVVDDESGSESDTDSEEEGDEDLSNSDGADEKSVVLDDGNQKNADGSSGAASEGQSSDGESLGGRSGQSIVEEENVVCGTVMELGEGSGSGDVVIVDLDGSPSSGAEEVMKEILAKEVAIETDEKVEEIGNQSGMVSSSPEKLQSEDDELMRSSLGSLPIVHEQINSSVASSLKNSSGHLLDDANVAQAKSVNYESAIPVESSACEDKQLEEPLQLSNYNSSTELEVLGLDRLKTELQNRGLKCGGTLQERAARLFLLKTTPIDKLPRKLLAKPAAGGK